MTFIPQREGEGEVKMKAEPAKAEREGGKKGGKGKRGKGGGVVSSRARQWGPRQKKRKRKKENYFLSAALRRIRWVWLDNAENSLKKKGKERERVRMGEDRGAQ